MQYNQENLVRKTEIVFIAVILLFAMLVYHPVTFLQHTLMWDTRDAYFPWRYFIGSCASHGIFPLWNPYLFCGYPFFADPQSGAFYPVSLIIGFVSGYPVQMLNLEFVLTAAIGGAGMYKLARSFSCAPPAAAFGAISFIACGFFVGNAEHLTWVISISWLVWLAWSYKLMIDRRQYGYAVLCAIFLYLVLTGGYPAFLFIGGYILLGIFVVLALKMRRVEISRFLFLHIVMVGLFAALSGVAVMAFSEATGYINRGSGVTLAKANMGAFTPYSLVSFFLPFLTAGDLTLWRTDISLSNGYFGIITLALLISAPPRGKTFRVVWVVSVLCLLVSFGSHLPLRGLLYKYVPFMNLFRFPSIFRAFFLAGIALLAAGAVSVVLREPGRYKKRVATASGVLAAGFAALFVFEIVRHGFGGNYGVFFREPGRFIKIATFHERAIMQSLVQVLLLMSLFVVAVYRQSRFFNAPVLLLLCMADMFLATKMNTFATVVNDDNLRSIAAAIGTQPGGFPLPAAERSVWENRDGIQDGLAPLAYNLGVFKKKVSPDGYDPFVLKTYDSIEVYKGRDSVWCNAVAYLAYDVARLNPSEGLPDRRCAAVAAPQFEMLSGRLSGRAAGDTLWFERFEPGSVQLVTKTAGSAIVVLQQADYPGWTVWVDGQKQQHFRSAYTNISVAVPAGSHKVVYQFLPGYFKILALVSYTALVGLMLLLVIFRKRLF